MQGLVFVSKPAHKLGNRLRRRIILAQIAYSAGSPGIRHSHCVAQFGGIDPDLPFAIFFMARRLCIEDRPGNTG
jgi:hypothetical protein